MNTIPYGKQYISENDIEAVVQALRSDFLTQGPRIAEFEENFAAYIGSQYAVAISNGTAALHLCAMALGVEPGHKVITSPITFAATANCIRYCGGEVELVDIDPETYLLDYEKVKSLIESKPNGTYKGIIPVDFAGRAVNLEKFRSLADKHDLWIIEDSCHAPGGNFVDSEGKEQHCGNGNFADLSIFSFHPVKHIAAGEGGMITTNDEALYRRICDLRTHGITRERSKFLNSAEIAVGQFDSTEDYPAWYMEMQELGYNYRLSDIQAALGNSQLTRAGEGLQKRREIAAKYYEAFKDLKYVVDRNHEAPHRSEHAYHLYVIEAEDRLGLYQHLRENQVYVQIHYVPVHMMPYYQEDGKPKWELPIAEHYYGKCLSLPMFPTLTEKEQEKVIGLIKAYYNA